MPVQKPRPPILIGGDGERVTLKLVAQYADYCNVFGDPTTVARKFAVLRQHCTAVGRPYDAITRSNHVGILIARDDAELASKKAQHPDWNGISGTPDAVLAQLQEYAAVGSQYVTFNLAEPADIAAIQLIGETVLPQVANW
jgi:alkanesulfonate monooxygenase SsuD/methylene tetrahydromethanopterin reductase-like flavin-dependent oxidoreductase (luciferase family)